MCDSPRYPMNIDTDTLRRIQENRKMALGKPRKPLSKVDEGDEGVERSVFIFLTQPGNFKISRESLRINLPCHYTRLDFKFEP